LFHPKGLPMAFKGSGPKGGILSHPCQLRHISYLLQCISSLL